jgi:hypothetical protein
MVKVSNGHSWSAGSYRPQGPRDAPSDPTPQDRSGMRIATAERVVDDAFAGAPWGSADRETFRIAFAAARDCLAEARELNRQAHAELTLARRERMQAEAAGRQRSWQASEDSAELILADAPGAEFCPDPQDASTPDELMDVLRRYRLWAGCPSYRKMASQCGFTFAASTLHMALNSDKLPSLHVLVAIVRGCRGSGDHQRAFASAWRRLHLGDQPAGRAEAGATVHRIRDTA